MPASPAIARQPSASAALSGPRADGSIPEPQLRPDLESGDLVVISARDHVDVELHWQRWRLDSPILDRLTAAVRRAAAAALRR